jgi:hypothetical protein
MAVGDLSMEAEMENAARENWRERFLDARSKRKKIGVCRRKSRKENHRKYRSQEYRYRGRLHNAGSSAVYTRPDQSRNRGACNRKKAENTKKIKAIDKMKQALGNANLASKNIHLAGNNPH